MTRSGLMGIVSRFILPAIGAALCAAAADTTDGSVVRVRMGASASLVGAEYSTNDAKAALVVWADTFTRGTGVRIDYPPEVITPSARLLQKVRLGEVDVFSCTTREYLQIAAYTDQHQLMVDKSYTGGGGEEYLILVRTDSGIRSFADLRGRRLARYSAVVMDLASDWLEMLLRASNLGPAESFLKISTDTKGSRIILPVFFRQTDACLVSRRTFDTMVEMNPHRLHAGRDHLHGPATALHLCAAVSVRRQPTAESQAPDPRRNHRRDR